MCLGLLSGVLSALKTSKNPSLVAHFRQIQWLDGVYLLQMRYPTRMRTPLIAANWKMNKLPSEAEGWANSFKDRLTHVDNFDNVDVVLCVPFTHLSSLHTILADSPVDLGAET